MSIVHCIDGMLHLEKTGGTNYKHPSNNIVLDAEDLEKKIPLQRFMI